jgi:hypothetical protein
MSNSDVEGAPASGADVVTDPALAAWEAWAATESQAEEYLEADPPAAALAETGADAAAEPSQDGALGAETAQGLDAEPVSALSADRPAEAFVEAEAASREGSTAHPDDADDEPVQMFEARPEDVGSASYQRLGAEGLVRLRARYAEVMARIAERPLEEPAREELQQRAERLNPDAWVTADEVSAALEQYETVFEGLRGVVGRHPRRRRRGRR